MRLIIAILGIVCFLVLGVMDAFTGHYKTGILAVLYAICNALVFLVK